jgi:hypothetical protein
MTEWLTIGTGPAAAETLKAVYKPGMSTVTCNSGLAMFDGESLPDHPDAWFCFDLNARRKHYTAGLEAQAKGSRILTLDKPHAANWDCIGYADERLELEGPGASWFFRKGSYTRCSFSGQYCIQYAINQGATTVHVVGQQGGGHYENGAFMRAIQVACPSVSFKFYGNLQYPVQEVALCL